MNCKRRFESCRWNLQTRWNSQIRRNITAQYHLSGKNGKTRINELDLSRKMGE